jgi:hypothetical protein
MFNLVQKFLSKNHFNSSNVRKNFSHHFYSLPEHAWIVERGFNHHFDKLFSHLPAKLLDSMMMKTPVVFTESQYLNKTNIHENLFQNSIVIFPEFQKLLRSDKGAAVAYLAHELAFVLLELEGIQGDSLTAEIEADKFVSDLGLTFELEEFLLLLDETVEKRLRLTYLTAHHFKTDE